MAAGHAIRDLAYEMALRKTELEAATMTGGEAIVQALVREGVEMVFGIPGVHTLELYDHLIDHPEIQHVVVRHEQGASFLADGYSRATGKVGVCTLITGPGLTNAATGIAQAYSDSTPLLILSSQNPTQAVDQERGLLHDLKDQSAMMNALCAYSETIYRVQDIPCAIRRAFHYLRTHRPQPVHLEFPIDVLANSERVVFEPVDDADVAPAPDADKLAQAVEALVNSERPLLVVGGGARGAAGQVRQLAERLSIPVVATTNGKGVFPESHQLALGANLRSDRVQEFVAHRDVVLAIGTELAGNDTSEWSVSLGRELYHLDIDYRTLGRNYPITLGIVGDARQGVEVILELLQARGARVSDRGEFGVLTELRHDLVGYPDSGGDTRQAILGTLKRTLADDAILVNDMTMLCYGAVGSYPAEHPRTFIFPKGLGTLGFSVPAAFGAKLGQPDRQVVALVGDGGFLFTSNELATAVKYQLAVPIILLNNESYGVVRANQLRRYNRSIGCDIVNPDFLAYARSFGAHAERIEASDIESRLPAALTEAFDRTVPTLIELRVEF